MKSPPAMRPVVKIILPLVLFRDRGLSPMTLTFELDLDRVKMNSVPNI